MIRKIFYGLLAAVVLIQFLRPQKNQSSGPYANDINSKFAMNDEVKSILKVACYDCHSNNTSYPWYANVQPVAWWLQNHVNDGKKHLNFHEFAAYTEKRQRKKFEEINEAITDGWMPLDSYTWIHKNAVLTNEQKMAVKKWVDESLSKIGPATSKQED